MSNFISSIIIGTEQEIMNKTFLILILMIISVKVNAQNPPSHRSPHLSFSASYMELKDQINHGFVFRGPDVVIEYGIQRLTSLRYFNYSFSVVAVGKQLSAPGASGGRLYL